MYQKAKVINKLSLACFKLLLHNVLKFCSSEPVIIMFYLQGSKPCPNAAHGCLLVLPPAQLSSHYLVCEFTMVQCPVAACLYQNIAKRLCNHIREVCTSANFELNLQEDFVIPRSFPLFQTHRHDIGTGNESMHTVSIHQIHQKQHLTFLREVSRKLFVISIHCDESNIYATIQVSIHKFLNREKLPSKILLVYIFSLMRLGTLSCFCFQAQIFSLFISVYCIRASRKTHYCSWDSRIN